MRGQENARSMPVKKQSPRWHRSRSAANQVLACAGVRGAGVDRATYDVDRAPGCYHPLDTKLPPHQQCRRHL